MQSQDICSTASYVSIASTGYFSKLVVDYLDNNPKLKPFYSFETDDEGLQLAIASRKKYPVNRQLLQEVVIEQYRDLEKIALVDDNIALLSNENTFTITSAHQPNLMTGYLYFIYKIIHSAKLAQHAKTLHPDMNFVPVFYIGSEDNDLEELGHFRYGNKVYDWKTSQTGAVGMMQVDDALQDIIKELLPVLGPLGPNEQKLKAIIQNAYASKNTIADATRFLVHELLGQFGIVVVDANDARLKRSFQSVIEKEVLNPKAFELVMQSSQALQTGYKAQAFFRPINFFYLNNGLRERIEFINNEFIVLNTEFKFSAETIKNEIQNHPERFSPNVILRGLYQESILPNIAFIGGGSEVAYWMQLKSVFEHYNTFFPMVVLRQSAIILDKKTSENQLKSNLDDVSMFLKTNKLEKNKVASEKHQNWALDQYKDELVKWESEMIYKFSNLDNNLINSIKSSITKVNYQFEILDKKINRAIKHKLNIQLERMYSFKAHAFPNDSLQERYDTFMPYYLDYGNTLFNDLLNHTHPYGNVFLVLKYK